MSTDILDLKYTSEEFDNLIKNVENTITEIQHDTGGPLILDISENRSFNVLISAPITGLEFINAPEGLKTVVEVFFIQDNIGNHAVDIGYMDSNQYIEFTEYADFFDVGVFQIRPISAERTVTICTEFYTGLSDMEPV